MLYLLLLSRVGKRAPEILNLRPFDLESSLRIAEYLPTASTSSSSLRVFESSICRVPVFSRFHYLQVQVLESSSHPATEAVSSVEVSSHFIPARKHSSLSIDLAFFSLEPASISLHSSQQFEAETNPQSPAPHRIRVKSSGIHYL